ncbi:MAG: DUF2079 domain-containing protein [Spirochaetes bacterium]|nr:DUF2079 domain-containing protein [Spirochaetota bacterium]
MNKKDFSNNKPVLHKFLFYLLDQTNIKYIIFIIISGFSTGFFAWSISIENNLFKGFIFQNILSPANRTKLLLFLFMGILSVLSIWILLSLILHYKKKEHLPAVLNRTSSWIFMGVVLWFLPVLSIQAIEVYYPFQIFILLLGMLILVSYIVYSISRQSKSFIKSNISFKWNSDRVSLFIVILCSIGYALFFIIYTVSKHYSFHSYAFDLGWYNQVFYTLVHKGWPFITLHTPLSHFSNHFEIIFYLLAPFYALFQNPVTLLILQSMFLASSAVPLYLIAKKRLNNNFLSVIISIVFLLFPALHGLNTYDFHGLVFFIPIFFFMFYFLETKRMKLFWLFFVLALITREDTPVTLIGVGLYIYFIMKNQKLGISISVSSIIYFLIVLSIMTATEGSDNYLDLALPESQGFTGTLITLFTNPFFTFKNIFFNTDKLLYLFQIFLPVLFLPFFAIKKMIIAIPGFAIILLGGNAAFYSIGFQYSAHIIPMIFILTIAGIENIQHKWPQLKYTAIAITLLSAGILMNYEFGLILSKRFPGIPKASEREKIAYSFFQDIPGNASVVTNARLYPHLSGREMINLIYRIDEGIEYVLTDIYPPSPALDLYETVYRGHMLDENRVKSIIFRLMNSGDYGVVKYNKGFLLLKRGHDVSKNKSTKEKINSLKFDSQSEINSYFNNPASSIPEPFTSISDVFIDYIEKYRSDTIIISVKDEATKRLSFNCIRYLVIRGSKINTLKKRGSYIAIIHKNKIMFEEINNSSAIEIDDSVSEKVSHLFSDISLEVSSAGYKQGNYSSIKVNGREYSQNQRGFNVVVLDSYLRVKETASFDMWEKVYLGNDQN